MRCDTYCYLLSNVLPFTSVSNSTSPQLHHCVPLSRRLYRDHPPQLNLSGSQNIRVHRYREPNIQAQALHKICIAKLNCRFPDHSSKLPTFSAIALNPYQSSSESHPTSASTTPRLLCFMFRLTDLEILDLSIHVLLHNRSDSRESRLSQSSLPKFHLERVVSIQ